MQIAQSLAVRTRRIFESNSRAERFHRDISTLQGHYVFPILVLVAAAQITGSIAWPNKLPSELLPAGRGDSGALQGRRSVRLRFGMNKFI